MTTPTTPARPTIDRIGGRPLEWSHTLPTLASTTYSHFNPLKHHSHYLLTQSLPDILPPRVKTSTTGVKAGIPSSSGNASTGVPDEGLQFLNPVRDISEVDRQIKIRHTLTANQEREVSHDGAVRGKMLRKIQTNVDLEGLIRDVYRCKGYVQVKGRDQAGGLSLGPAVNGAGRGRGRAVGGGGGGGGVVAGRKRSIAEVDGEEQSTHRTIAREPTPIVGEWIPPPKLPIEQYNDDDENEDDNIGESITVKHPPLLFTQPSPNQRRLRQSLNALRQLQITEKPGAGAEHPGRKSLVRRILGRGKKAKSNEKGKGRNATGKRGRKKAEEEEEGEVIVVRSQKPVEGCVLN